MSKNRNILRKVFPLPQANTSFYFSSKPTPFLFLFPSGFFSLFLSISNFHQSFKNTNFFFFQIPSQYSMWMMWWPFAPDVLNENKILLDHNIARKSEKGCSYRCLPQSFQHSVTLLKSFKNFQNYIQELNAIFQDNSFILDSIRKILAFNAF